jgi:hypothetical protein
MTLAVARAIAAGLEASLNAIIAYVKPCTLHALSPAGLEAYASLIVRVSAYSAQLASLGADIADGRYQPGSGKLGQYSATMIKEVCTRFKYCPHDLAVALPVLVVSYAYAAKRGRASLDLLVPSVRSVLAHTGGRDVEEVVSAIAAVAPREHLALEDRIARLPLSPSLQDLAAELAEIYPSYACLAKPEVCLRLARQLDNPLDRYAVVKLWLNELLPRCAPGMVKVRIEGLSESELQRRLLSLDLECRKRKLNLQCYRMVGLLASVAFIATTMG